MNEKEILDTFIDRVAEFGPHGDEWSDDAFHAGLLAVFEAGQESTRPLIERAQAAVRAHLAPHDPEWLEEHDRKVAHDAWEACSAEWIRLNPGVPVIPEEDLCCVGDDYCDLDSSPKVS